MSELLKEVLINKDARSGSGRKVAVAKAASNFQPWRD